MTNSRRILLTAGALIALLLAVLVVRFTTTNIVVHVVAGSTFGWAVIMLPFFAYITRPQTSVKV